jgi:hypothetical protein
MIFLFLYFVHHFVFISEYKTVDRTQKRTNHMYNILHQNHLELTAWPCHGLGRVTGLSFWWSSLDPSAGQVGLVVDEVALGQVFLPVLQYSLVCVIHTILHTHYSFIYHQYNILSATGSMAK